MPVNEQDLPGLIAAAVHEGFRNNTSLPPRTGTVVAVDSAVRYADILMDGDVTTPVSARLLASVDVDDRALVLFTKGGGVWCFGALGGPKWLGFDVDWTALGSVQPDVGDGTLTGFYRRDGSACDIIIQLICGATTTGGREEMRFSLPFPSAHLDLHDHLHARLNLGWTGGVYLGFTSIEPEAAIARVFMPITLSNFQMRVVENADATGAAGTGVPAMPGHHVIESGNAITITGRYRIL